MKQNKERKPLARVAFVLMAFTCLLNGGCLLAAAGAACGAAVGYAYYEGKLCHSFHASCDDTAAAVRTALAELSMPLEKEEHKAGETFYLSRTAGGDKVRIFMTVESSKIPAMEPLTRVSIRVAVFGDERVSTHIMDQIAAHLVSYPPPPCGRAESSVGAASANERSSSAALGAAASTSPPGVQQTPPPPLAK